MQLEKSTEQLLITQCVLRRVTCQRPCRLSRTRHPVGRECLMFTGYQRQR